MVKSWPQPEISLAQQLLFCNLSFALCRILFIDSNCMLEQMMSLCSFVPVEARPSSPYQISFFLPERNTRNDED